MKYVEGVRWSCLLFVLAACGAPPTAPRRAERAPEPSPIVAAPEPAPRCAIEVHTGDAIEIALADLEPFTAAIDRGAATLTPTDDPARYAIEVASPLRFDATARSDGQMLELAVAGERAAGAVTVAPGTLVRTLHARGEQLVAELQLGHRVPGARRGLELAVGPVPIDCADVRAVSSDRLPLATPTPLPSVAIRVADPPLTLRPVRAAPAEVTLTPLERGVPVPVWVLEEHGDDARVAVAFGDETRVEGWATRASLRAPSDEEAIWIEAITADVDPGEAVHAWGGHAAPEPTPEENVYVGVASLRPSSPVLASPDGPRWAESVDVPLEVRVRWDREADHAQLLRIPGLFVSAERAWVRLRSLSIPSRGD